MKRFLLFAYDQYYPLGGWHDFVGSYDTRQDARDRTMTLHSEHWQIIDSQTGVEVDGTLNN